MTAFLEHVERLSARLPELEWKLSQLKSTLDPKSMPRGLFRARWELTPHSCAEEIRADLTAIKQQINSRQAHYIAERVSQKINVLIQLYQLYTQKQTPKRQVNFGVKALSTRQQWLHALHDDIGKLSAQRLALNSRLMLQKDMATQVTLNLQAELGEIERCLTLAKETLTRATRW